MVTIMLVVLVMSIASNAWDEGNIVSRVKERYEFVTTMSLCNF